MSRIFFDVDTQKDFMDPNGALYVPGAVDLIPNINRLTEAAIKYNIQILGSLDVHFGDEAHKDVEGELSKWGGPFPDHCIWSTQGGEKVNANLFPAPVICVSPQHLGPVVTDGKPTFFEKQTYDVFTNANLVPFLTEVNATEAFVYGVATDYCVLAAVRGLRKLGIATYVVQDAVAGVAPESTDKAIEKMVTMGAFPARTADVVKVMDAIYGS